MGDILIENRLIHKPLLQEGSKAWKSEESIQQWVNDIEHRSATTSEASSPTKSSFDSDVFLQLPGGGDPEELALGAEAKHYGHFSPRLSPLVSFEKDEQEFDDLISQEKFTLKELHHPPNNHLPPDEDDFETQRLKNLKQFLQNQQVAGTDRQLNEDDQERFFSPVAVHSEPVVPPNYRRSHSLTSQETYSSFSSSFDKPSSLAAFLRPDPEELLYSLGFCNQNTLLQCIPERFFLSQSEAYGIDVASIYNSLLLEDQESDFVDAPPPTNKVLKRFSQSSIDLHEVNSVSTDSSHRPSLSAKTRRILFKSSHQDIPSIHLTRDEDRPFSPASLSITSSGSNWMRLETLKEVPEPLSRTNSFDIDVPLTPVNKSIRTRLDSSAFESLKPQHRKLSDTDLSRGETLIEEDSNNEQQQQQPNHFVNSLRTPFSINRTLSNKSASSCVTVIDSGDIVVTAAEDKISDTSALFQPISSHHNDNGDDVVMADITPAMTTITKTNDDLAISAVNRRSLFGSSKTRSCDNVFSSGETPIRPYPSSLTKSADRLTVSENLINEEIVEVTHYIGNKKSLSPSTTLDLNDVRKASLNESFMDFIKSLASDGSVNGSSHNNSPVPLNHTADYSDVVKEDENVERSININVNAHVEHQKNADKSNNNNNDDAKTECEVLKTLGEESFEIRNPSLDNSNIQKDVVVTGKLSPSIQHQEQQPFPADVGEVCSSKIPENDNHEVTNNINSNSTATTTKKSGYLSAALNSLSNVFNRQSSLSSDNLAVATGDEINIKKNQQNEGFSSTHSTPLKQQQQKNPVSSSLFRLFNHQTLSSHNSNSAFSSVSAPSGASAAGGGPSAPSNGLEVELDGVSDSSIDGNSISQKNVCLSPEPSRGPISPGYDADSPEDSDVPCKCPKDLDNNHHNIKRRSKHNNSKKQHHIMSKGRSLESSGFEEDHNHQHQHNKDVKCPFGKNCSLLHKNGRHVYPESTPSRLNVRKVSEASSIMRSRSPSITSTSIFTYEHFEYLVQQMTYLRAEMKEQSQEATVRERDLKEHFDAKFEEMKKSMASDYMGWIKNEMEQLKTKLNEKDEEIRRLRDVIAENEARASNTERRSSFGTPV